MASGNYLSGSILKYCRFSYGGSTNGIIYLNGTAPFISNCSIYNSLKTGIFTETTIAGGATIVNSSIRKCNGLGTGFGSGIHIRNNTSSIKFTNNNVYNNTGGTGVYIDGGRYVLQNLIHNNQGGNYGGGLWVGGGGTTLVKDNEIYSNSAGTGGGICIDYSNNCVIKCNKIFNNTANVGAAIYARADSIVNNIIISNGDATATEIVKLYQSDQRINYNGGNQFYGNSAVSIFQIFGGNPVTHKINQNTFGANNVSNIIHWTNWSASSSFSINENNFLDESLQNFIRIENNLSSLTIDAKSNYWSLQGGSAIESKVFHFNDDFNQSIVDFSSPLSSPAVVAPISSPKSFIKTQNGNNVDLAWVGNQESDILGYLLYWGGGYHFNFINSLDIGNVNSYSLANFSTLDSIGIRAYSNSSISSSVCNNEVSWYSLAAADILGPVVGSYSPADNATGVAVNANLVLTFNKPVQKGTGNIVIKEGGATTQTISVTGSGVTVSGSTVTINPIDFGSSAAVNVEIAAGAFKDLSNNNYAGITIATTWNFTSADVLAPTVNTYSPADNGTGVAIGSNLVLTFSESITKGTTGTILIKEGGATIQTIAVTDAAVTVSGTTVTINPPIDLGYNAAVNIEIAAGAIKDLSGNSYAGITTTTVWNFTTVADLVAPIVSTYSPADNAIGVAVASNLVLTFSENIQKGTTGNILIKEGGITIQTIAVTDASVAISGTTVTIKPPIDFTSSALVNVEIAAGTFKDLSNNNYAGIADAVTWNFAVADVIAPTVTVTSTAPDPTNVSPIPVTITFSESVTNFIVGDITVTNGTAGTFAGSGTTYTAQHHAHCPRGCDH